MQLTYYGHACFGINVSGKNLLFDPFISPNELAKHIDISAIAADYIFVSHGHADHVADVVAIAKNTGAKVICSWEVYEWLTKKGLENIHPMNVGGAWRLGDITVRATIAQHSSGLPDGTYGGNPMGFLIYTPEGDFHYSGDTALTLDMQLIPYYSENLRAVILPIGDNFTMGYHDAITASDFMKCDVVVGVHYDTFGFIKIDKAHVRDVFENRGKILHLPNIGETISLI